MPEPLSNLWSKSRAVLGRSILGASQTGLPSTNDCRSSAHAFPVPLTRTPKKSCRASGWTGNVTEYSVQAVVPFSCRLCMLSKARAGDSPSSRIHRPTKSLTSSVRRKPRNSIILPKKSMGMDLVMVEKLLGLSVLRSIRADHRPPWTTLSSAKTVPGGPPPQPPGMPAEGSASKLRMAARSDLPGIFPEGDS